MIRPKNLRERLILAAAVAFVLQLALNLVALFVFPHALRVIAFHGNYVQPASCVFSAISLLVGGWIGGKRFLPIGVVLVLVLQLLIISLLVWFSHNQSNQMAVSIILQEAWINNRLGVGLQLLAAAVGAIIGSLLHARYPLFSSKT